MPSAKENGGERPASRLSIDPVLLTFSATPELASWLRDRAARNVVPIQQQIREELEEHKRWCVRDRAGRNA
jgi:hypothetical protein